MDLLGLTHTATATAALLLGPAVFFRRKGDRTHRRVGYAYVASMVILNVTALAIYDLFAVLAARVSETLTRLPRAWPAFGTIAPPHWFWTAVAIGTAAVMVGALYLIRIRRVGFPGP